MKKSIKIAILYFFLLTTPLAMAQEFESGSNVINLGIGFGGNFGSFTSSSVSPGFSLSYERGIWDIGGPAVISLGAYIGRKTYKNELLGTSSKWSYTTVGVRGAYHYNGLEIENLDVYGGAMLGYNISSFNGVNTSIGSLGSTFRPTIFVGGRWYFSDVFGVFAEAGYGVAYLTLGGTIRF